LEGVLHKKSKNENKIPNHATQDSPITNKYRARPCERMNKKFRQIFCFKTEELKSYDFEIGNTYYLYFFL
jgi:hypothetical protein